MLLMVFVFGALSSLMADFPEWAFREWARYAGLLLLACVFGGEARDEKVQQYTVLIMLLVGGLSAFQFFNYYVMAFFTGVLRIDPFFLVYGFDNPRFLGQFQILLLPLLAAATIRSFALGNRVAGAGMFFVLVAQWCIVWALAGRGVWLGLLLSHVGLFFVTRKFNSLMILQVNSALLGFLVFIVLFSIVPFLYGIDAGVHDGLRFGLSRREVLWGGAVSMAWSNPIFGAGPMHFSAVWNHIGAHPHQLVLLLLAEWGSISTILIFSLFFWGLLRGVSFLRAHESEFIDAGLWLSLVGALVLAQVDGVLVMPYAETWLVIIVGVAMSRWSASASASASKAGRVIACCLAVPVLLILGWVLIFEAPKLMELENGFFQEHSIGSPPRFWAQGWIPM